MYAKKLRNKIALKSDVHTVGIKKVCEVLQAIRDTSVTNQSRAHGHKVLESMVMNQVANTGIQFQCLHID